MLNIILPTHTELEPLLGMLTGAAEVSLGGRTGYSGILSGRSVRLIESGIGQANTAQTMTAVLEQGPPGLVVLCGCAGAYRGTGLKVGDVAVATEEVYADLGLLTPAGWEGLEETGIPLMETGGAPSYGRFILTDAFNDALAKAASDAVLEPPAGSGERPGVHFGVFLTVSTVSGTAERGDTLHKRFGGICENMEGAAAAQVAAHYGSPLIEVRGISNMVEDRDRERWDITAASANCARFIAGLAGLLG